MSFLKNSKFLLQSLSVFNVELHLITSARYLAPSTLMPLSVHSIHSLSLSSSTHLFFIKPYSQDQVQLKHCYFEALDLVL